MRIRAIRDPHARLDIPGTYNFRDVGGYPADGGRTRFGQLYRSDALSRIPPEGLTQLADLEIGVVVDLRSDLELRQDRSGVLPPGAVRVSVPIHGGSRSAVITGPTVTIEELYRQVLVDSAWSLAAGVSIIAESGQVPVLVNCTAGKDRTGLVVALALEVAGVDRTAVVADYTQSALNLDGAWINRTMTTLVSHGVPISPRLFEVLGGSPDHAMSNVLAWLDREYGSIEAYLTAHGLIPGAAAALRDKLVTTGRGER